MADPVLVDQYGRSIGLANYLYRAPSQRPGDFRPVSRPRPKTYEAVTAWARREMVDVARVIAAGVPNIDTALVQAGEYSIGESWHIKSRSANKAWGKRRDEWFNQTFARVCNIRGGQNDWRSSLRQLNWTRKVEADYGLVFDGQPHKDPLTGREIDPTGKFQVIKYDRINSGLNGAVSLGRGLDDVKELGRNSYTSFFTNGWGGWIGMYIINDPSSPFDGQRILDGVIVDANMRVLGYRITGFNDNGTPTYCDVPEQLVHVNFSARTHTDLIRGIPELAVSIIPTMGLDDIQYLITMAVKLASAMAVTRESSDGDPNRAGRANFDEDTIDASGNSVKVKRAVEEIFPGIIELATNNKEALKALEFNRPSMNEEQFIQRIETSILHKLWPRSLIYAGDSARAGTRVVAAQANTICSWDQICVERSARWIADRATEYAMRAGFIPGNDNLYDPYEYVFTVPGKFTVDEGNDAKMRLQALGRCTISRGIICELDGYLAEEIEEMRRDEVDRTLSDAEALAKKHSDWTAKEIAVMLDNSGGNVTYSEDTAAAAEPEGDEPPEPAAPAAPPSRNGNGKPHSLSVRPVGPVGLVRP